MADHGRMGMGVAMCGVSYCLIYFIQITMVAHAEAQKPKLPTTIGLKLESET